MISTLFKNQVLHAVFQNAQQNATHFHAFTTALLAMVNKPAPAHQSTSYSSCTQHMLIPYSLLFCGKRANKCARECK